MVSTGLTIINKEHVRVMSIEAIHKGMYNEFEHTQHKHGEGRDGLGDKTVYKMWRSVADRLRRQQNAPPRTVDTYGANYCVQ